MNELKPCPFCGALPAKEPYEPRTVQLTRGVIAYWVRCYNCGIGTCEYDSAEPAIEAWNRRAKEE